MEISDDEKLEINKFTGNKSQMEIDAMRRAHVNMSLMFFFLLTSTVLLT